MSARTTSARRLESDLEHRLLGIRIGDLHRLGRPWLIAGHEGTKRKHVVIANPGNAVRVVNALRRVVPDRVAGVKNLLEGFAACCPRKAGSAGSVIRML